jgi:LCP family protein required for cell wall assembly
MRPEEQVTQIVSHSSRRSRHEPDARHANSHSHAHSPFNYHPIPEPNDQARGRHATSYGQNFERVIGWTLLGSLVPGTGLIAAGRRSAGFLALTMSGLLITIMVVAVLAVDRLALTAALLGDPRKILILAGVFILVVLGWVGVVISTHSAARQYSNLTSEQRTLASLLVGSLIAMAAVPTVFGARAAYTADDTIRSMFRGDRTGLTTSSRAPDSSKPDPWANISRVNVLLMGGDSGLDRVGIRPDTLIVASIDTRTGNMALISLPRNLERVPFPPGSKGAENFPNGFYCTNANGQNTECLLNALWTWGDDHPDYYPESKRPGLTATVQAVEQLTGLAIDQFVMLNLRGFEDFVDAIGGVILNAKTRVPVGGHGSPGDPTGYSPPTSWIRPGVQQMDGYHALWYARARQYSSDFDRMQRQRCVIGAVVHKADPPNLALGFQKIMETLKKNFLTSIPLKDVEAWVTLTTRVKKGKITSLVFTNTVINTTRPDVPKMRDLVQKAINPPADASPATAPLPTASDQVKVKGITPAAPAETGQATDLTDVC